VTHAHDQPETFILCRSTGRHKDMRQKGQVSATRGMDADVRTTTYCVLCSLLFNQTYRA